MTAEYPTALFSPRTIENRPGVTYDANDTKTLYAEDLTALADEIIAIETVIGLDPAGSYDTVVDRLDAIDSALSAKAPLASPNLTTPDINDAKFVSLNSDNGNMHIRINEDTVITNNSVARLYAAADSFQGFFFINNRAAGGANDCIGVVGGGGHSVALISNPWGNASAVKDTAGKLNFYWNSTSSRYELQNKTGGTVVLDIYFFITT